MSQPSSIGQLLPAAVESRVPAKQESKLPETIEGRRFAIALSQPKIKDGTEEDLKMPLRYVYILIGLRAQNYPAGIEKQLLHQFIFDNYGGHAGDEIKLAFEMAITQKLDVDATCYENFSIAYFAKIMEAYRSWAREQVKQLPSLEVKPKEFTKQEKLQLDFDFAFILLSQINKLPCKI